MALTCVMLSHLNPLWTKAIASGAALYAEKLLRFYNLIVFLSLVHTRCHGGIVLESLVDIIYVETYDGFITVWAERS